MGAQYMHLQVEARRLNATFMLTVIYAFNNATDRQNLRDRLVTLHQSNLRPWLLAGDSSCVTDQNEKLGGSPVGITDILNIKDCLQDCGLTDMRWRGCLYTWNNRQDAQIE